MEVIFANPELERLEVDKGYDAGLDSMTVVAFRMRLQQIRATPDENTLFALRSLDLRHRTVQGKSCRSMKLAGHSRLILELKDSTHGKVAVVSGIEGERTAQ